MDIILALVLLVGTGLPLAYAVTRTPTLAVVVAPLTAALQCVLAATLMIAVGGPLWPWLVLVTVGAVALAGLLVRRPRSPMVGLGLLDVVVMYLPLVLPSLLVLRPPVAWDARSIWWFHAAWFEGGSAVARAALANPALAYSHPDYPPLTPATIAGAWTVTGESGVRVAQIISTVLVLSAVAVLMYAVRHLVPTAPAMAARLVALGVGLGLWFLASYGVAAGYVDHLWAAAAAAAAVLLFVDGSVLGPEDDGNHLGLAVVLLAVAALTKNEGLVAVAIVAVLFTIRGRHHLRRAAWVWAPVAAGIGWSALARINGATSDLSESPRITALTHGDLTPLDRAYPTVTNLFGQFGVLVSAALVVSVLGLVLLRQARRDVGLASVLWPWAVMVGYFGGLVLTYVISPYDLTWHLGTSGDRVGVLIVLLSLAVTASWILVAVAPEPGGSAGSRPAADAAADIGVDRALVP